MDFWKHDNWRLGQTLIACAAALVLLLLFWRHYLYSPWTRDGRVRVEIVDVAAQVSGEVTALRVVDNQQVRKGDPLFEIEVSDYKYALAQAEATLASRQATLRVDVAESQRRMKIAQAVSAEEVQSYQSNQDIASAAVASAVAARDQAKLNLQRTTIYSPVNGYITNLHLRVGDYATPGQTKLNIVDSDSFWVAGYFEETKLPHIHDGDRAKIKLMGVHPALLGHVGSFARGIADTNAGGEAGLATVDPVFTWVRLAQRIPIRIEIDRIPKGVRIAAGQTCTVEIDDSRRQDGHAANSTGK